MDSYERRQLEEEAEQEQGKEIYLSHLEDVSKALKELGDDWAHKFVESLTRQISRQRLDAWGPSPKQNGILEKIKTKYGDLLDNDAKRRDLIRRRAVFVGRLEKLQAAAALANDEWLTSFLNNITKAIEKGFPLTPKQKEVLQKGLRKYKLASEEYSYDRR